MRELGIYNPFVLFAWFFSLIIIGISFFEPTVLFASFLGGCLLLWLTQGGKVFCRKLLGVLVLIVFITLFNAVFSHKGMTVLFYLNNRPITFESVIYGLCTGLMLGGALMWFDNIGFILNCDSILYILAKPLPKIAMLLSLCLRLLTGFTRMTKTVSEYSYTMGLDVNNTGKFNKLKRLFSSLIIRLPEDCADISLHMQAKGFGSTNSHRKSFYPFFFKKRDAYLLIVLICLVSCCIYYCCSVRCSFFPMFSYEGNAFAVFVYLTAVFPSILLVKERIIWKFSQSKI